MSILFSISLIMTIIEVNMIKDSQEQIKAYVNLLAIIATITGAFFLFSLGKLSEIKFRNGKK